MKADSKKGKDWPYSVQIDPPAEYRDPEYLEYKRTLRKDKAHFDYVDLFERIIEERKKRKEIMHLFGSVQIKNGKEVDAF